ncbi:MAG TPA: MASE1 domain-containing protein [Planctomycetota bacterium]|nr:MASE1 domain-containing protein [Planctomycetota bacterium]
MRNTPAIVHAAVLVGLAAAYSAGGKLGLSPLFALRNVSVSPVWPPTGIALAAMLVLGVRVWPAIFVGAFLVNFTTTEHPTSSFAIAVGNTLEGVFGALLVQRYARGRRAFERPQDVFKYVVLAGLVATLFSPTIGVTSLELAKLEKWPEYGSIWLTWWLGDACGALVLAPPLVLWSSRPFTAPPREAAALLAVALLVGMLVYSSPLPLAFLCLPVVVWAGFRFGSREAATAVLVLSVFAILGTVRETGSLPDASAHEALLVLQAFLGVVVVTSLSLAAVVAEWRRAQQELQQHAVALARSNEDVRDFAHIVSHDLKAPLRGIAALASWLGEDLGERLPERAREQLRLIVLRVERMERLISDVLAYSRAGVKPAALAIVDPGTVLDEVIDLLGPPAGVRVRIDGALPLILYDRTQLLQVFQNLIGNAIKHLGKPTGEVAVSARKRDGDIEFLVRDNGVGIDARYFDRIFKIFQTADTESQDTGVGLAIVKKIVEMHGGAVAVESTVGAGSTFRFTVPGRGVRSPDGVHRAPPRS